MKKIIKMFKKLLNVKKGGMEFWRLFLKLAVWIFVLGAFFYGLVWIPNQLLNIENAKLNLIVKKAQRNCDLAAQRVLLNAKAEAQKAKKEVTKEQEITFYNQNFAQCMFLEGFGPDPKPVQTQTPQQKQQAPVAAKDEVKKEEKVQ